MGETHPLPINRPLKFHGVPCGLRGFLFRSRMALAMYGMYWPAYDSPPM